MRLIPAIDLKQGRCVRLYQGDYDSETHYAVDPQQLLDQYVALGADWLHVVDLDAARRSDAKLGRLEPFNGAIIRSLAARGSLQLQVGGGLRDRDGVGRMLDAGAARVVIGSAAMQRREEVRVWLGYFGAERVTIAFDVRLDAGGTPRVATNGWQQQSELSLWDAMDAFSGSALKHVLCTDVARDGALTGPNISLYLRATRRYPHIAWQASGGVRNAADLQALADAGAAAAISGKALLEGLIAPEDLQPFLPNA